MLNTPLNLSQPGGLVAVDRQESIELHVGRTRFLGVGHRHKILEARLRQVSPRLRILLGLQLLGIDDEDIENAGVRKPCAAGLERIGNHRGFLGLVRLQQLGVGFEQLRADAPDHIALGIGGLGARAIDDVARSRLYHVRLDARGLLEFRDHALDDIGGMRGIDADALLGQNGCGQTCT